MNHRITFTDVRNMGDKELAKWLENIWQVGFITGQLGGNITDRPNFYNKLKEGE